jgi:hypothetical protein
MSAASDAIGDTASGAISGAAKGSAIASGVATGVAVGTDVAATAATAAGSAAAAGTAIGVGGAIGNIIPIPGVGAAIGALIGAFVALGEALSSGLKDTFHPDASVAAAWLLAFQIAPGLVFAGVDTITPSSANAAALACRLVRYFRLIANVVPNHAPGQAAPAQQWPLYNPTDLGSKSNPYIESATPDKHEPMTNIVTTTGVLQEVAANHGRVAAPAIRSMLKSPKDAQAALMLLRSKRFNAGIFEWAAFNGATLADFRASVSKVRAMAGEKVAHDARLEQILGGPVRPDATHLTRAEKIAAGLIRVSHPSPTEPREVPHTSAAQSSAHDEQIPTGLVVVGVVTAVGAVAGLTWLFSSSRKKG